MLETLSGVDFGDNGGATGWMDSIDAIQAESEDARTRRPPALEASNNPHLKDELAALRRTQITGISGCMFWPHQLELRLFPARLQSSVLRYLHDSGTLNDLLSMTTTWLGHNPMLRMFGPMQLHHNNNRSTDGHYFPSFIYKIGVDNGIRKAIPIISPWPFGWLIYLRDRVPNDISCSNSDKSAFHNVEVTFTVVSYTSIMNLLFGKEFSAFALPLTIRFPPTGKRYVADQYVTGLPGRTSIFKLGGPHFHPAESKTDNPPPAPEPEPSPTISDQ